MIEIIDAIVPPLGEPTFATPDEAIRFRPTQDRIEDARAIGDCVGFKLVSACWERDRLNLYLANRARIEFFCRGTVVCWTVRHRAPEIAWDDARLEDQVLIRLDSNQRFFWQRGGEIGEVLGQELVRFCPSQCGALVYFARAGILMIDTFLERATNAPFLCWEVESYCRR